MSSSVQPLAIRIGKAMRPWVNALIARQSTVAIGPVLPANDFAWVDRLEANWRTVRDEALVVTRRIDNVPPLGLVSPDHARIARGDDWRSFFLHGYGHRIEANRKRCPATTALIDRIPDLNSAFFSVLAPGTHIPRHRGVTKGLLTCHLGLQVPVGDCAMLLDDRLELRWTEARAMIFDDSYSHEVTNATAETRIILLIQFQRPTRLIGRLIIRTFLSGVRRTRFVAGTIANLADWERDHGHDIDLVDDRREHEEQSARGRR